MEIAIGKFILTGVVFSITFTITAIWITYFTIKKAIKHGIQESGLIDAIRRRQRSADGTEEPSWMKD